MNVVLIVSDTLRRDHLGCYGNRTVQTPNIDALAAGSVVFERYYGASFPTMPARADLMLGKFAFAFMAWEPYGVAEVPVGQRLAEAGFATVCVADTPFYMVTGMGYDRGFTHFYDMGSQPTAAKERNPSLFTQPRLTELDYCAPATFLQAERCLERVHERPFFLMVDTWDPHEPWDPPPWYLRRYRADVDRAWVTPTYGYAQETGVSPDDLAFAHDCYMAEITMVDRWVGRLLERIESLGIADQTAVLFVSDHGFYFGEHGGLFGKMRRGPGPRGQSGWLRSPLYEELVHLPLMARLPGLAPRRTRALASAADLTPTVLELAGVDPAAGPPIHGRSLVPAIRGQEERGRPFVVSALPLINPGHSLQVVDHFFRSVEEFQPVTITDERWSLLYSAAGEPIELYDLAADPGQTANVADAHPAVIARLHANYVGLLERCGATPENLTPRSRL